ncbi:hypothetical protein Bca52824_081871 [Brassica carinata]|uniref:Uncharacterized protein n=1 Tax=Brassica carinata TaxID=52824 RepID=A0A8X7PI19_BRACI|nr:hypothetical protein Bca52824_081871 [Brassica carinata]
MVIFKLFVGDIRTVVGLLVLAVFICELHHAKPKEKIDGMQAHTNLPIVEGHSRANWETITPACIESVLTIISSPSTDLSLSLVLSSRPTATYPWVSNPTLANRLAERGGLRHQAFRAVGRSSRPLRLKFLPLNCYLLL